MNTPSSIALSSLVIGMVTLFTIPRMSENCISIKCTSSCFTLARMSSLVSSARLEAVIEKTDKPNYIIYLCIGFKQIDRRMYIIYRYQQPF